MDRKQADPKEELEERVAQAREQVKAWPEWVLTRSGFDRVLRGERVEVPGERVEPDRAVF